MTDERARLFLPFGLLIAILAVSTASIFIRFAQADGAPSLVIAALRLTIATIIISPLALTRHRAELQTLTGRETLLGVLSGIFLAIHFATWISSLEYTSVASSMVFVSTGPLWVALLSPLLLKEHLSGAAIVGLILSFAGGTIVGLSDACRLDNGIRCPGLADVIQGRAVWGNFLALAGAWAVTGYLIIGRKLRGKISLTPYLLVVYGFAAAALLIMMFAAGYSPLGYPSIAYIWILLIAVIPQLIGHSTYNWALRYVPATFVAIITLIEPISSAILAFFVLRESPTSEVIFGGCLILAGVYLVSRR